MNPVPPYAGQNQSQAIQLPRAIQYRQDGREDNPWAMIPYEELYPQPPRPTQAPLPPPIGKIDLWTAMQTWPL